MSPRRDYRDPWIGNRMPRLLVIDDDVDLCEVLLKSLLAQGFDVEAVHDGSTGVDRASSGAHVLLILGGTKAFELLRQIRAATDIPIVLLNGSGEEIDRIVGLEVGADDSVSKPFNPRELVARVRAVLRRTRDPEASSKKAVEQQILRVHDLEMDVGGRLVREQGRSIDLTSVEFDLLKLLLAEAGRTVSRDDISRVVLGRRRTSFDRSIDVHIASLRRKLGQTAGATERIRTIRGIGYLYAHPAETL